MLSHYSTVTPAAAADAAPGAYTYNWQCEYCSYANDGLHLRPDELPDALPAPKEGLDYTLLAPPAEEAAAADAEDTSILVFVCDVSGSMCVTEPLAGAAAHRLKQRLRLRGDHGDDLAALRQAGDDADQWMPHEARGVSYVSRLQALQAAVDKQLSSLATLKPNKRVALVTFASDVLVIGDGSKDAKVLLGEQLADYDGLVAAGEGCVGADRELSRSIGATQAGLQTKLFGLEEGGQTALGPAVLLAVAMAGSCPGSKVVVCTDGVSNQGLGSLEPPELPKGTDADTAAKARNEAAARSDAFYDQVGGLATSRGVVIDVIGFEGAACNLEALSRLAEATNGSVTRVNAGSILEEFDNILEQEVVATNCQVTLTAHIGLALAEPGAEGGNAAGGNAGGGVWASAGGGFGGGGLAAAPATVAATVYANSGVPTPVPRPAPGVSGSGSGSGSGMVPSRVLPAYVESARTKRAASTAVAAVAAVSAAAAPAATRGGAGDGPTPYATYAAAAAAPAAAAAAAHDKNAASAAADGPMGELLPAAHPVSDAHALEVGASQLTVHVGQATEDSEVTFSYTQKPPSAIPAGQAAAMAGLTHLPFQLAVQFTRKNGGIYLRVITSQQRVTRDAGQAERAVNASAVMSHASKSVANLARRGRYAEASAISSAYTVMLDRNADDAAVRSAGYGAWRADMGELQGALRSEMRSERAMGLTPAAAVSAAAVPGASMARGMHGGPGGPRGGYSGAGGGGRGGGGYGGAVARSVTHLPPRAPPAAAAAAPAAAPTSWDSWGAPAPSAAPASAGWLAASASSTGGFALAAASPPFAFGDFGGSGDVPPPDALGAAYAEGDAEADAEDDAHAAAEAEADAATVGMLSAVRRDRRAGNDELSARLYSMAKATKKYSTPRRED